jgi:signal transduction histidine kinase
MKKIITRIRAASTATQDTGLAVVLCLLDLLVFSDALATSSSATGSTNVPGLLIVAYAAAGYAALRWRRQAPLQVFVVLWLHSMIALLLPGTWYRPTLGLLVALYTVAAHRSGAMALGALLAVYTISGFATAEELQIQTSQDLRDEVLLVSTLIYAIVDTAVYGIGRWARATRQHASDLERRREVAAQEAVAAERTRIARELHDIVSHAVTVMVLQAAGAQRVLNSDPARAEQALTDIEDLGTQAMGELRRLLAVLRAGEANVDRSSEIEAQPGLADLDDLVASLRSADMPVQLQREGAPGRLDGSVNLAAYRVVQEALTNVTKHAGARAKTTVRLTWEVVPGFVEVRWRSPA